MSKKTFDAAENAGAILITQVKENQKNLLKQIKYGCSINQPTAVISEDFDKKNGRLEQRKYEIFESLPMLNKWQNDWPFLRKIIRVTRSREVIGMDQKPSITTSYYVSSGELTPEKYAKCIREHWFIENKLHNIKDATFREDFTVKQVNPWIFSLCIDFALNILKSNKIKNIRDATYRNSMNLRKFLQNYETILCL